jgi:hypothetical protein
MQIAERNRLIKKVLSNAFGQGKVTVRGSRGTAYGWVSVKIDVRPKDSEHRDALKANVWELFKKHNIEIGTYGTPGDMGCDYGWGSKIHLDFGMPLDQFEIGECVTWLAGGKVGKVVEPNYRNPGWYMVQWTDAEKPEEFYKGDLSRIEDAITVAA